jgi:ADP-ribose pyrophosphatase YjhB (NUDIX family)
MPEEMSAELFLPRVGCGAAIIQDGQLLLVRRRRPPEAEHWGLPGGKIEPFETAYVAVTREIAEEIGIKVISPILLCIVDQIDRQRGEHWLAPVYLVERFEGEPNVQEPEALSALGWFPVKDLPMPLTMAAREAVRAITKRP